MLCGSSLAVHTISSMSARKVKTCAWLRLPGLTLLLYRRRQQVAGRTRQPTEGRHEGPACHQQSSVGSEDTRLQRQLSSPSHVCNNICPTIRNLNRLQTIARHVTQRSRPRFVSLSHTHTRLYTPVSTPTRS